MCDENYNSDFADIHLYLTYFVYVIYDDILDCTYNFRFSLSAHPPSRYRLQKKAMSSSRTLFVRTETPLPSKDEKTCTWKSELRSNVIIRSITSQAHCTKLINTHRENDKSRICTPYIYILTHYDFDFTLTRLDR